jgi:hypothetical protein
MCVPLQEVVEPALKRLESTIVHIYRGSWADWKADPRCGVYLYKRTRADLMHEHAVRRGLAAFSDIRGVRALPGHETCHFLCDDQVLFRFKKGDDDGRTSNIQTELALAYHDPQTTLFDLPDVHRVDVAYVLNSLQTDIAKIFVVGRDDDKILWRYDVLRRAGEFGGIAPLPTPPAQPRSSLVKPRGPVIVPFPGDRKAGEVD